MTTETEKNDIKSKMIKDLEFKINKKEENMLQMRQ